MSNNRIREFLLTNNLFISFGIVICLCLLVWFYGCESKVRSLDGSKSLVTRGELQAELDVFLERAEARYRQLDRQDMLKMTLLNHLALFAETGTVNPLGVVSGIIGILGTGAIADNVRVRKKASNSKP